MTRTPIPRRLLRRLVLAAAAALSPVAAEAQSFPADEDLRLMVRYLVEDGEASGIVLGVLEADGTTRFVSHGSGGPDTRPLGPRSVYEIGSINKTFTGVLLADLVARGVVSLDDPVSRFLPEGVTMPSRSGREITLLDLATHTSGLPRLASNHQPANMADPYADYSVQTMYAFITGHELRRDPGALPEYSNLGFGLLGHVLARAAGAASYEELVRQRILQPLGMTMTGYPLAGDIAAWMVKGYRDRQVTSFWFGTDAIHGAGGLRSNAEDMLRYVAAHLGPPDDDLERAMRVASTPARALGEGDSIGLGWQMIRHQGRRIVMHGGGTGGFSTHAAFDPERRVGYVLLTNSSGFGDDIGMDFLRRGAPLDLPVVDVPRERLAAYAGVYEVAPGQSLYVRLEPEGYLTLQAPRNVRFRMYADADSQFYLKRTPWRFTFRRDASGAVTGLRWQSEGSDRVAQRTDAAMPRPAVVAGNEVESLPLAAAEFPKYEGTYRLQLGPQTMDVRVFAQNDRLMAQATGQSAFVLHFVGNHSFAPAFDPTARLAFTVEGDRATGLTLHQGGQQAPGTRVP